MTNPLLETWDTAFGLPPFARIADADFAPAMAAALAEAPVQSTVTSPSFPAAVTALAVASTASVPSVTSPIRRTAITQPPLP